MKLKVSITTNLKIKAVQDKVKEATEKGFKDVIVDIANDVIKIHPWETKTGTNSRSIRYKIEGIKGSVYSTSGYGGWLEVGTRRMRRAYPYFKPAYDKHFKKLPERIKERLR